MIEQALAQNIVKGTISYAGNSYDCSHSPINTQLLLSVDGGGFSPLTAVTIILYGAPALFKANTPLQLTAQDGTTHTLRVATIDAAGNGYFTQLTCHHVNQGA
jgi:hypothetical protein